MTPTEQDKEIRDIRASSSSLVATALKAVLSKVLVDGQNQIHDLKDGKATPEQITERMFASLDYWQPKLMQLITADRKRVELEARIDEMKLHRHEWELFGDRPPYKGENVSLPILLAYHDDRIAELKAQQEEV